MQLGMIGLGRMGANMARRLMKNGHTIVAYDRSADAVKQLAGEGATGANSLDDMIKAMPQPRHIWIMVPSGAPTESTVTELASKLAPGDTIIDGGNSFWKDDIRRAKACAEKKISYVDAGTSGGVYGLERGYCLMVGGEKDVVTRLDPIFKTLAPGRGNVERTPGREKIAGTAEDGYLHCGTVGAGHFTKMVHNGIEYGIMQAIAEGFDIMKGANNPTVDEAHRFQLPVADIAEVWRRGSVLSSWLIDLTAKALVDDPQLQKFTGSVEDSGEGRWTVDAAIEERVSADVIAASLFTRFRSRQDHSFAEKMLSAMRFQFGGHVEQKK
ncbi:MAG: decarboxylating 6-phosphogluconate dehydrogenase [Kofleriaceae bacterium]